jgi:hypothetical protein
MRLLAHCDGRQPFLALGEELPRPTSVQNAHGTSDLPKMPTRRSLGWKEGAGYLANAGFYRSATQSRHQVAK